jgi:hypothetical protein
LQFSGGGAHGGSQAVTEALAELAEELKPLPGKPSGCSSAPARWTNGRFFTRRIDKFGTVESHLAWSPDDKDWADRAEQRRPKRSTQRQKDISEEALAELVNRAGPMPASWRMRWKNSACYRRPEED